jgi:molybdopterin molybdotransferase
VQGVSDEGLTRRSDGKVHLVRVRATYGEDGRYHVTSSGGQGSHQLSAMAAADALVVLDDGEGVPAGGPVTLIPLGEIPEG